MGVCPGGSVPCGWSPAVGHLLASLSCVVLGVSGFSPGRPCCAGGDCSAGLASWCQSWLLVSLGGLGVVWSRSLACSGFGRAPRELVFWSIQTAPQTWTQSLREGLASDPRPSGRAPSSSALGHQPPLPSQTPRRSPAQRATSRAAPAFGRPCPHGVGRMECCQVHAASVRTAPGFACRGRPVQPGPQARRRHGSPIARVRR